MRDPNRLDYFYDELKKLHKTYLADWRFGQLMYNFIANYGDPFYLEEDVFLEKFDQYIQSLINEEEVF